MPDRKTLGRKLLRLTVLVAAASLVVLGGVFAWKWHDQIQLERIEVLGARYADEPGVVKLARLDSGDVLFDIEPALVQDRVRKHPWVRDADVARIPTGTLRIRLQERKPEMLVLDAEGAPAYYLDAQGYTLPLAEGAAFDVPLLTGVAKAYQPGQVMENAAVVSLLGMLAALTPNVRALVSEIVVQPSGELWMYATPLGSRGSIPVRLGRSGFGEKLTRLHAFWMQAVLPQEDKKFTWIDLRFNSQIVTDEETLRQ